ncbi:hypothetical protein OCS_02073 [Ophiocordyceps sinensis CO18]|uniref:Uncharacterized protein n=1 Tax=Ophiocordyceps sinensis (strain Co18 / CGMCC 3.14243) TaxID=911162 RepID=T5AKE9_OPHSC|nr:hypothetical protein OCS_02073 [Ophiocordyceps sinensis CO18]
MARTGIIGLFLALVLGSATLVLAQEAPRPLLPLPFATTGIQVSGESVPFRRNIDDLVQENGPQW